MVRWLSLSMCLVFSPALVAAGPSEASGPAPVRPKDDAPAGAGGMYAYLTRDGTAQKVPLFSPESASVPVATVGADVITLDNLVEALAAMHGSMGKDSVAGTKDFTPVLDRLIEVRLLAAEAREMGIDELPEVKQAVASFKATKAQEMLQAKVIAGVKLDRAEAERIFRDRVCEWKVRSVLFGGELDAKQGAEKLRAGAFEATAKQLVADKKATGTGEAGWLPRSQMLPQVVAALQKLKTGSVSAPVKVQDGFAVMRVEEIRYPEDPKARTDAARIALAAQHTKALKKYYDGLVKRWAKVDRALLKRLDYHAKKPGFEALRKDARVLASFEGGGQPITVAELTEGLERGFFHGTDRAIKEKKINKQKEDVFDGILSQRVIPLQVKAEKIDESPALARFVAEYENGLLFSKFVEKAVVPQLSVTEDAVKAYHQEHRKDFMYPAFYKVESLAFGNVKDAESAIKQLRGGTDFKWLNANATGQIPPDQRKLAIEGTLAGTALPGDVAGSLAGVKKGDYRIHAGPESQFYAVHVVDVIGATEKPYEEVRDVISKKLFNDALVASVKKWSGTLRNARPVKVFITKIGA